MSYRVNVSLLAAAAASLSSATELTFSGMNLNNYDDILASYGDNVTGPGSAPTGTYLMGAGWTPNITTTMQSVTPAGAPADNHLDYWSTNYGDLVDVAFSPVSGNFAQITLIPDSGFYVNLISFDLAGYPQTNLQAERIRILDANGGVLWSAASLVVAGTGPTHSSYMPNIVSNGPITIEWGTNWNIGIDNVSFTQRAVPEPTSMAALGLGLAVMARRRRR